MLEEKSFIRVFFFFQAEDGIRDHCVTGVQTCALPICSALGRRDEAQENGRHSGYVERTQGPGAEQPSGGNASRAARRARDRVAASAADRRRAAGHSYHHLTGVRSREVLGGPRRSPGLVHLGNVRGQPGHHALYRSGPATLVGKQSFRRAHRGTHPAVPPCDVEAGACAADRKADLAGGSGPPFAQRLLAQGVTLRGAGSLHRRGWWRCRLRRPADRCPGPTLPVRRGGRGSTRTRYGRSRCDAEARRVILPDHRAPEGSGRTQATLKYTTADAPTNTTTRTKTRMAGSNTTRSARPVVVECISRIPTVAR